LWRTGEYYRQICPTIQNKFCKRLIVVG